MNHQQLKLHYRDKEHFQSLQYQVPELALPQALKNQFYQLIHNQRDHNISYLASTYNKT